MLSETNNYEKNSVEKLVMCLVKIVIRPKIFFEDEAIKDAMFRTPSILISNHTFAFNGAVIGTLLKNEHISFLLAKDMYKGKFFTWFYNCIGCIPIDRRKADTQWIHKSSQALSSGKHICIFPEGRVSHDNVIKEFKSGFALLAKLSEAPLIPLRIIEEKKLIGTRSVVLVGRPIFLSDLTDIKSADWANECAQKCRRIIIELEKIYTNQ